MSPFDDEEPPLDHANNFFLSWLAAKSFITYLTLESFIPTSMLSIIILTMRLGVTLNVSEVPYVRIDTATWRHFPRHLVWFSHAFPLDSFSRTARTRSHVHMLTTIVAGNKLRIPISTNYVDR